MSMTVIANRHARQIVEELKHNSNCKKFNIKVVLSPFLTRQSIETILGYKINLDGAKTMFDDLTDAFKRTSRHLIIYFIIKNFIKNKSKFSSWMRNTDTKHFQSKKIAHKILQSKQFEMKSDGMKCFLDVIIDMKINPNFKNVNPIDHIFQVLVASTDTSLHAISNLILLLGMHPDVQEKCYQEIKSLWVDSDQELDLKIISELKYINMTIKESIRLISVLPCIVRSCKQDVKLGKKKI